MNVKIGQTEWSIIEIEYGSEFGQTDPMNAVILLNKSQQKDQMRDTLLHEVLHAIVCAYGVPMGDPESEEAILKTLTPALLDVLCVNPKLTEKLLTTG